METNKNIKRRIFLLWLFFPLFVMNAQSQKEEERTDTLDFEKIVLPSRFPVIENTKFSLDIDPENYTHPIQAYSISSRFGFRSIKLTNKYELGIHRGVDITAVTGTPVYAIFDGTVRISTCQENGYGNVVVIRHKNGLESLYAHLDKRLVIPGQKVISGDCIALSGNTGVSTGPHLHFELSIDVGRFDPELLIDFTIGKLKNIRTQTQKKEEDEKFL